jgi:anti-sigma-K factor RskA
VDINDYIASGNLELYVAGALTPEESREVEAMAAAYPEVAVEIAEIQSAMEMFAAVQSHNPRPQLRSSIMHKIAELEGPAEPQQYVASSRARVIPLNTPAADLPPAPATPLPARAPARIRYMMAASIVFALLCGAAAFYMGSRWQNAETQLADARRQNEQMAQENGSMRTRLEGTSKAMAVMHDPAMHMVRMAGVKDSSAMAMVFWNPNTKELYMDAGNLPPAPEGKAYQLWALQGGTPVDAGVLPDASATRMHRMKDIGAADAFAVTLEPAGGRPTPTMDELKVMGKI